VSPKRTAPKKARRAHRRVHPLPRPDATELGRLHEQVACVSDLREKNEELRGENARLRLQCEHQLRELDALGQADVRTPDQRQRDRLEANLRETAEKLPGTLSPARELGELTRDREEAVRYKAEAEKLRAEAEVLRAQARNDIETIKTLREERNVAERKLHALSQNTPENLRQLALDHLAAVMRSGQTDEVKTEVARDLLHATE